MARSIGIDFGTMYSSVSYKDGNKLVSVESTECEKQTPTEVCFTEEGVFAGMLASENATWDNAAYFAEFKQHLGDPAYHAEAQGTELSASALTALILKKLVSDAERQLGDSITGAVIACPAYFGDAARAALMQAGEAVTLTDGRKLKVLQLVGEDVAAACAYAATAHGDIRKTVLLLDLGGGAFQCSVVKLEGEKCDVIASAADRALGGSAWDEKVLSHVLAEFCRVTETDEAELRASKEFIVFRKDAELLKKTLSSNPSASRMFRYGFKKARITMTAAQLEECTSELYMRVRDRIDGMLKGRQIKAKDIDEVVLTGGGARMQLAQDWLGAYGKTCTVFDPDKAIANGAAILAQKYEDALARGDMAEEDVPPAIQKVRATKSYGVKVGNLFGNKYGSVNLVVKGTELPAEGSFIEWCHKHYMDQHLVCTGCRELADRVYCVVLENDSCEAQAPIEECEELYEETEIVFEEPIPGDVDVDFLLKVSANGMLTVTILEPSTGKRHSAHPVRKGGDAASKGLNEVSGFTLA